MLVVVLDELDSLLTGGWAAAYVATAWAWHQRPKGLALASPVQYAQPALPGHARTAGAPTADRLACSCQGMR